MAIKERESVNFVPRILCSYSVVTKLRGLTAKLALHEKRVATGENYVKVWV